MSKTFMILLLAGALASPAVAQPAPADDQSSPIVVQGVRIQDKEIDRFVDALTEAPTFGQISRFDWAVCPAAVGLGDASSASIVQRMTEVARAASIPVAKAGCKPNVLVIVTRGKSKMIERLSVKYPAYFEGLYPPEIRRLIRDKSSASAWQAQGRIDADGQPLQRDIDGRLINERTDAASRLSTASRPHFLAAVVVAELDALAGLTVTQFADYAAMRTFARTDPRRVAASSGAPTILSAIEAPMNSPVPLTLTSWDMAFLKSLYSSDPNRTAAGQRGEMKQIVERDLTDGKDD